MDALSPLFERFTFNAHIVADALLADAPPADTLLADAPPGNGEPVRMAGQLYLLRQGQAVFMQADAAPLRVTGTAMVFYPRGMRHRMHPLPGAEVLRASVVFDGGHANPLLWALPERIHVALAQAAPLWHTLALLFAEAGQPAQGGNAILDRLCDILMIQVMRHEFDGAKLDGGVLAGLADRQLGPVLSAMHGRPDAPWQLQTLAAIACMSRTGFAEHFRKVVGIAPLEYLTRWRMGLACRLLREGVPVKVVSGQAGYTSAPAFTRAFTGHVGVSPRHWLRGFAA
jgi:AraC-like DNA-binding protein